ncbi:MAG TPA: hypothetical protein VFE53_00875 [Mucilaginibacter sp.]|nr:hypothetical protein [Mucilaginibacter sp.]
MNAIDERLKEQLLKKQNIKRKTNEDDLIENLEPDFDVDDFPF